MPNDILMFEKSGMSIAMGNGIRWISDAVWALDSCMHLQLMSESETLASAVPAYRILEKQGHLTVDARSRKKLDPFVIDSAFQGF